MSEEEKKFNEKANKYWREWCVKNTKKFLKSIDYIVKNMLEEKYLQSLGSFENAYMNYTKSSVSYKPLSYDITSYVNYLEKQLQEKDEIIRNITEIFNDPNNSFSDGCDCKKIEDLMGV